jgi:hypothetical protein
MKDDDDSVAGPTPQDEFAEATSHNVPAAQAFAMRTRIQGDKSRINAGRATIIVPHSGRIDEARLRELRLRESACG